MRGAESLGVLALDDELLLLELLDPELLDPELEDSPLEEPEELEPEDPDDPDEPDDVDPPRGTAWPFATAGAASAAVTIMDNARRVDLTIARS